ncbi:MAG: hypothetical protein NC039_00535 [Muribaculaceae bacterium]|nr:hypothetical protein [Muribaculaceae bacterium]
MRQFLRYASLLTVLLITVTLTSSCNDEEEFYDNPLVGTWQMVAPLDEFYNEFTFYADGSGSYYVEDDWGSDTYYIYWYVYGNQLQVDFPDQMDSMYFTWQSDGYTLYLYPSDGSMPWVYRYY